MSDYIKALKARHPLDANGAWVGIQPMVLCPTAAYVVDLAAAVSTLALADGVFFDDRTEWTVVEVFDTTGWEVDE